MIILLRRKIIYTETSRYKEFVLEIGKANTNFKVAPKLYNYTY